MALVLKFESVWRADNWHLKIQSLQTELENHLGQLIPTFAQRGYAAEDEIEAQLKITETGASRKIPLPRGQQIRFKESL